MSFALGLLRCECSPIGILTFLCYLAAATAARTTDRLKYGIWNFVCGFCDSFRGAAKKHSRSVIGIRPLPLILSVIWLGRNPTSHITLHHNSPKSSSSCYSPVIMMALSLLSARGRTMHGLAFLAWCFWC
jgi:hypothetical protein